jgi:mRNA interferase MazF
MKRGEIITVSAPGDYGKPRPAVVIQSDELEDTDSVLLCLMTTVERDAAFYRVAVNPTPLTGLRQSSQIMVDKIVTIKREKCSHAFGRLDQPTMLALNRTLALVIGIAD